MKPARGKTPRKTPKRTQAQTDPVQVFCRVRPPESINTATCVKVISPKVVQLTPPEDSHAARNGTIKETQYTFEHVFDEYASQKAVFDHIALPLAEDVLHGKNALLFAYGVTSSGKTHTMTGTLQNQGILPRCLDVLFNSIGELQAKKYVFIPDKMNGFDVQTEADAMAERQRKDILPQIMNTPKTPGRAKEEKVDFSARVRDPSKVNDVEEDNNYAVFVSYVEIYNNVVYDLLEDLPYDPITGFKAPQKKDLREDSNHNMYVSGCVEVEIKSTEEAYELLAKGQKKRKVAHTALNAESSRSHSVFNIRVVQAPLDPLGEEVFQDKEKVIVSQLALVDLAGSERTNRTGSYGDRLKEAGSINQVLMVLRGCIEALRENQKSGQNKHIPYRDSRLTNLFRNSFEGQGKVRMIVCCNPKASEYDETVHVMRFAELTQEVQVVRQQQVRFDMGLTPGRRRMNQQYKEAIAKMSDGAQKAKDKDGKGNLSGLPIPPPMLYSMGPGFPLLTLTDPTDDSTLATLASFLREREVRRQTLLADLSKKQDAFRQQLLDIERDNIELRQHNSELEARLTSRDSEVKRLERKLQSVEQHNAILQKTANQYEREQKDLQYELGERELRIHQEKDAKQRLREDYRAKLVLSERQLNDKLEKEKAKLYQTNQAKLRSRQQKLDLLKNIINNGNDTDTSSMVSDPPTPRETRFRSRTVGLVPAKSEPDLANGRPSPAVKPPHLRSGTTTGTRIAYRPRHRSPPPVKPKPVVNPRYHRRSKSSGDVWLDHKPAGTINTGTLNQPLMDKKKQVNKVTTKNVKLTNKYCLTHQEVDSEGEVATKLVKGTVVPSATGGSNVVFSDVEIIKQRSPGDRKRRSPALRPEDFEGEWTDTDDRCRVAVEGHGFGKRTKHSVV